MPANSKNEIRKTPENTIGTLKASEISGYSKSYISQLCREHKFAARQDLERSPWQIDRQAFYQYLEAKGRKPRK